MTTADPGTRDVIAAGYLADAPTRVEYLKFGADPIPDQPDNIDEQSRDLPDPARAAERVRAYIEACGDGLYDVQAGKPLYARDLEAIARDVLNRHSN